LSARKLTVLSIVHPPVFGGPHNTVGELGRLLKADGVETIVVLPDEGEDAAARMREMGVEVLTVPLHRMRAVLDPRVHLGWLRALRGEVAQLARIIEQREVDVVVTHSLPNLHGGLAARRAGVACVWELIDSFPPRVARWAYMPLVLSLADVVMTTGRRIARMHPGTTRLGRRWINFYPSVDVRRFSADPTVRENARRELGLPPDALVIGNVANVNPMKGHATFIRAAAELRTSHPDAKFVILGATYEHFGDYTERLWRDAAQLGLRRDHDLIMRDPGRRVRELAQAFDLFWMTSEPLSEGLPTVIGEAKALGLPVVTTDVGSTSECVSDGVSGYVVAPRDPHAIADATRKIIDDPVRRESMGVIAREEAVRDYAAERCAEAHRRAFAIAIDHHRRRRSVRRRARKG
jgi:glycosyltransferase involved in cell wall biosynthesis